MFSTSDIRKGFYTRSLGLILWLAHSFMNVSRPSKQFSMVVTILLRGSHIGSRVIDPRMALITMTGDGEHDLCSTYGGKARLRWPCTSRRVQQTKILSLTDRRTLAGNSFVPGKICFSFLWLSFCFGF